MRVDLLRDLLKHLLTDEDYAKCVQLEPKREEPTIYQDLANKFKEHGKVLSQVEHHRSVVRDAQLKLHKHEGILHDLLVRSQSLQLEINSLQAQVEAAKAASASGLPSVPPSVPPGTPLATGVQIQEIPEGDEETEEVDDEEENGSTVGSGVGAFLAPQRKKTVKKTFLKKPSAKNAAVKPGTRSSVFAKAGMLSARELKRLIAECSDWRNKKRMRNWRKVFLDQSWAPLLKTIHRSVCMGSNFRRESQGNDEDKNFFDSSCCTGPDRVSGRLLSKIGRHCTKPWIFRFWRPGFYFHFFGVF